MAASLLALAGWLAIGVDGTRSRFQSALILVPGSDAVSVFSVRCNAVLDRRADLVMTAGHCVDARAVVAIGGDSLCRSEGWQVLRDLEWRHLGSDLAAAPAHRTHDDADLEIVSDQGPDSAVPEGVTVGGFGQRGGIGPPVCEPQTLVAEPAEDEECRKALAARPHYRAEMVCVVGPRLCPGWSGAGLYSPEGALLGVVVSGTTCLDPNGLVVVTPVWPRD